MNTVREISFSVRSLGSEKPAPPSTDELGKWIHDHIGRTTDLTGWKLETTLRDQLPAVTLPTSGGRFYAERITAALPGIVNRTITAELDLIPDDLVRDSTAARNIAPNSWWAIPSPAALHLTDAYFGDDDDAAAELTKTITKICRTMRDAGAAGHLLIYDAAPDAADIERFSGRRYLRHVPDTALANVLELQRDLILTTAALPQLPDLADSYTIRIIYLIDPDPEALETVCRLFDPEDVHIAGIAPEIEQKKYWNALARIRLLKKKNQ